MKLFHHRLSGPLSFAASEINRKGWAEFEVVAMQPSTTIPGEVDVVLRVPNGFHLSKWYKDEPETVEYQLGLFEQAAQFRAGKRGM